ncbi:MAG: DUF229 domain-containing protein [Verrucomicrobia bacterium]|nr:DUF229 domain-containing protein [Verrucomicrobiota bacterium]
MVDRMSPSDESPAAAPAAAGGNEAAAAVLPAPWDRPRNLLLLAAWFGLLAGAGEALCIAVFYVKRWVLLDKVSEFLWTIPLTDAVLLGMFGGVLCVLARLWARLRRLQTMIFWFGFVAVSYLLMSALSLLGWALWGLAAFLLAAGIAMRLAAVAAKRPRALYRLVMWTAPAVVGVSLAVGAVTAGGYWLAEQRAIARLPPAPSGAPNVLLLVLDTVRAKSMSLHGYALKTTPHLERWAQRGVLFENAVAPSSFTLTSHATMFTGLYPHELSADWCTPLEGPCPTLAEVLSARGYMTAGFVGNKLNAGRQTGLDRGFVHFEAHRLIFGEFLDRSSLSRTFCEMPPVRGLFDCYEDRWGRVAAEEVNRRFLDWLKEQTPERPFFAFLNYVDCHTVYLPRTSFADPDQPFSTEAKQKSLAWTLEAFAHNDMPAEFTALAQDAYNACLRETDGKTNDLLTELEKTGQLRNTIVIIVGDHGEQFGEHGLVQHSDSLYRPAIHVPLLILHPKNAGAKRVRELVTLRDLPATILDLLGIPSAGIPGDSFAAAVAAGSAAGLAASTPKFAFISKGINYPDWHPNARDSVKAVFLEGKQYIKCDKQEELYDFETDLEEKRNLARTEGVKLLLERCRRLAAPPVSAQ